MLASSHDRALRAAIRLALATSTLGACSRSKPPVATQPTNTPAPGARVEAAGVSKPEDPAEPSGPTCAQRLDEAFPEPAGFSSATQRHMDAATITDPELVACCYEELDRDLVTSKHRWDCCQVRLEATQTVDPALVERVESKMACTPWGPPAPPRADGSTARRATEWCVDLRSRSGSSLRLAAQAERDGVREAAMQTWRGRMVNEYGSAQVFEALGRQFEALGRGEEAEAMRRFATDERRHGVQCGAVVRALGGQALAVVPEPASLPEHRDAATPLEAVLRNVLSVCCLSETVAVALIGAERLEMEPGPLRDVLSTILADEVAHARFGWTLLDRLGPVVDAGMRRRLSAYLEVAFEHLFEHELEHLPLSSQPPAVGARYGLCNGADARRLFFDVVREGIVPGLRARGFAVEEQPHKHALSS